MREKCCSLPATNVAVTGDAAAAANSSQKSSHASCDLLFQRAPQSWRCHTFHAPALGSPFNQAASCRATYALASENPNASCMSDISPAGRS